MAKLQVVRGSQYPLASILDVSNGSSMVATDGVEKDVLTTGGVFDAVNMPQSSVVVGGEIIVDVASDDTGTATVSVGDASSATRYATTVNLKSTGRTALDLTGYVNSLGENLRVTVANANGNASVGKFRVNVMYLVDNRVNEVQTH